MTSKTDRYPEHVLEALRQRIGLTANDTSQDSVLQASTPRYAAEEMAGWYLGSASWFGTFEGWVKACGGRIVWDTTEEEEEELDPTVNHYDYAEEMDDDETEGSWEEVLDKETGAVWRIWEVRD